MASALDIQTADYGLEQAERDQLARDGYVIRAGVFPPQEIAAFAEESETLIASLEAAKGEKVASGSYVVEANFDLSTVVKWEPNHPDVVMGIELFVHFNDRFRAWARDPRLIDPCKALVGQDALCLFTEKINVKRARNGGDVILHQDFTYWERTTPVADRIVTAMVCLDDMDIENGCLEVAPGSHTAGKFPRRAGEGAASLEMDPERFDLRRMTPVVAKAGDVVFFGSFLVHRSLPNHSDRDRRALFYSYQPAGAPHLIDVHRVFGAKTRSAAAQA